MKKINHIHFTGIGGIGMSGIAEVVINQGFTVSGSDQESGENVAHLKSMGADISLGHDASYVSDSDVVVISSAIKDDNPEILEARRRNIPVIPRAEMLSELMRKKFSIAVSGTHGKTTTTSMIAYMLNYCDASPTYVIGGRLLQNNKNSNLGEGEYFVVEADESDASFLLFHPVISVVTNIDNDHLSVYNHNMVELEDSFLKFISDIPFYGCSILCVDDERISRLLPSIRRRVIGYGFSDNAAVKCTNIKQTSSGVIMQVVSEEFNINSSIQLRLFGKHNVLNALAALSVGLELDIDTDKLIEGLEEFEGISRRFNVYSVKHKVGNFHIVDDYGHHPTEIKNVICTIKESFIDRRLIFIFEPHRFSRVKVLFDDFVESLLPANCQIILPIYSAGEDNIWSISSSDISNALRSLGAVDAHAFSNHESALETLDRIVEADDIVLFMGAGYIGQIAKYYIDLHGGNNV